MKHKFFINKENAIIVIVDIQEKLVQAMKEKDKVVNNCSHLIECGRIQCIPIVVTEQYSKGLGPTISELKDILPIYNPIEKITFDCCGENFFNEALSALKRKKIILTGMETHVCVLQTCLSLIKNGFDVHIVKDAVCSRTKDNFKTAIEIMRNAGAVITCTETVLFQLLEKAGTEEFKAIAKKIK
ncbi:MAG: hydrolase [Nitrospiraceae bacterium]|nr:hydrolase [Nitrospiraceae bacterium]